MSYDALCKLIKDESPYGLDVTCFVNENTVRGLAADNKPGNEMTETSANLSNADQFKCVWWYFGEEVHRCPKVIKIPIEFQRNGRTIKAHVFLGYGGPGA